jgi:Polyketide cyclase / dehydrase and lipid transport
MKELHGSASATTSASPAECMTLLEAIDGYPTWAPDVIKLAEVLERDDAGHPTRARAKLHVERGPLRHDFDLQFVVRVDPAGAIELNRIPHVGSDKERFDVTWRVDGEQGTRVALKLVANLDVPRFIPLGGVGDSLAEALVSDAMRALGRS